MKYLYPLLQLLLLAAPAIAQQKTPPPQLNAPLPGFVEAAGKETNQFELQKDGKIVVFTITAGNCEAFIRINPDGSLDPTFKPVLKPGGLEPCFKIQPDGKMLLGDRFESLKSGIARLNADGFLDRTFKANWPIKSDFGSRIHLLPDGKILMTARFDNESGINGYKTIRLNTDGTLDSTFKSPPIDVFPLFLVVLPNGKILFSAALNEAGGKQRNGLFRLNSDGSPDQTFGNPQKK